MICLLM